MNPIMYIVGSLLVVSSIANGFLKVKVNGLEDDVVLLQLEATEAAMNARTLNSAIETQNHQIDMQRIDILDRESKIDELKAKPEKIRYNTVYKYISENIDVSKTDCETTVSIIDAARSTYSQ